MPSIALENIRSAYNVWNIIRSADALWFNVILLWYSPSPFENEKVKKHHLVLKIQ
jgi:tRNA G18 (ribose-2'-O)-methylase SpoU